MRILVIGANGFVGRHMLRFFLQPVSFPLELYGTYRSSGKPNQHGVEWVQCDLCDKTQIAKIVENIRPDHIVHLASPAFIPDSFFNPRFTVETIFLGTLNVLEAIRQYSPSSKLLYIGSANEYGNAVKAITEPITEKFHPQPDNIYSLSKHTSSLLCRQYAGCYGIHVVCVRPFNHIGPGQSEKFACSSFARQIAEMELGLRKTNVIQVGNLSVKRDFLDVRDVISAYWQLMLNGESGQVYNVCSGKSIELSKLLNLLITYSTMERIEVTTCKELLRPDDKEIIFGSPTKLFNLTGWVPKIEISQTLTDILEYWRNFLNEVA